MNFWLKSDFRTECSHWMWHIHTHIFHMLYSAHPFIYSERTNERKKAIKNDSQEDSWFVCPGKHLALHAMHTVWISNCVWFVFVNHVCLNQCVICIFYEKRRAKNGVLGLLNQCTLNAEKPIEMRFCLPIRSFQKEKWIQFGFRSILTIQNNGAKNMCKVCFRGFCACFYLAALVF